LYRKQSTERSKEKEKAEAKGTTQCLETLSGFLLGRIPFAFAFSFLFLFCPRHILYKIDLVAFNSFSPNQTWSSIHPLAGDLAGSIHPSSCWGLGRIHPSIHPSIFRPSSRNHLKKKKNRKKKRRKK
jgi:hypothetical protein